MQFLFLHKSIDQRRLVVFGRSLGGAVATHLATVPMYAARISCVILENTFVSLPAIAACVFGVKALSQLPRWCYKNKVSSPDISAIVKCHCQRGGSVIVRTSAWHFVIWGSIGGPDILYFRYENMSLDVTGCVSLGERSTVGG